MTAFDPMVVLAALLGAGDGAPAAPPTHLDGPAWEAVLELAGSLDLQPALWSRARHLGLVEAVPDELVEILGDRSDARHHPAAVLELAHRRNQLRNRDLLDQLDQVLGDFAGLGIEVLALKGTAHLVGGTWPDPADRAMSDLDLLIDPGAGPSARRHLEHLGYVAAPQPGEALGGHHHLPALRHPHRFGSIELHVEPLQRGWRPALDAVDLWAEGRITHWRGHRLGLPSPGHTALISLVHGYLADGARYEATVPLRMVHELWRFDRWSAPVDRRQVRDRLDAIGWPSLVDDFDLAAAALLGDGVGGWGDREGPARVAARLRLAVALARGRRPEVARVVDPVLRVRSSLDVGRLRRHYGTAIDGPWSLRRHHLSQQLPGFRRSGSGARPRALLLTPELPSPTGNGLAMRAEVARRALSQVADVTVAVVGPPAPPGTDAPTFTPHRAALGAPAERGRAGADPMGVAPTDRLVRFRPLPVDDRTAARSWLVDAGSRRRLAALEPLTDAGRLAHPDAVARLAAEVTDPDQPVGFDLVHVVRLRMAPWAEPFGFRPGVVTVLDLDDDEVVTHDRLAATAAARDEGDLSARLAVEGQALGRMADWYAPRATVVTVASPDDRRGAARHRPRRVDVLPNAVGPEPASVGRVRVESAVGPGPVRLLLVGNFTYAPNRWAADVLVDEVRPELARRLAAGSARTVSVDLVGSAPPSFERFAGLDGVTVTGPVASLVPAYEAATLVVVPLSPGGGTRIKVLEAFARRVPVVATPAAVEGLGVIDGRHALLGDDAGGLVEAALAALADPRATRIRVELAAELAARHDIDRVARQLAERYAGWSGADAPAST